MTDPEEIERRLSAVERAVAGERADAQPSAIGTDTREPSAEIQEQITELEERVTELEAATRALRGYVGEVRSVNEDVERRAESALAAVENLEERIARATQDNDPDGAVADDRTENRDERWTGNASPGEAADRATASGTPPDGIDDEPREMPVPGSRSRQSMRRTREATAGAAGRDRDEAAGSDDGLFDRVREVL